MTLTKITEESSIESGDVVFNLHLTSPQLVGPPKVFKLILNIHEFIVRSMFPKLISIRKMKTVPLKE